MSQVVIIGAGIAGLTTALLLARAGHEVTLCERDPAPPPPGVEHAFTEWARRGVAQFFHPHSFLGRARELLVDRLPDVHDQLLASGARVIDFAPKLPSAEREPGDARFRTLACRRATLDWVLRDALAREPGCRILTGVDVAGLAFAGDGRQVTGVRTTEDGVLAAELVVDAGGRRSGLPRWLADAGIELPEASQECETLYYSRHYQLRPDEPRPEGDWLLGPGAELGVVRFALDEGDSGTFAVTVCAAPSEPRLRALRHEAVWTALAHAFPGFAPWLARSTPLTGVLPMGSLRNVLRRLVVDGAPRATGVLAIGDALCHTNPQHAWGGSLAMHHAAAVADALAAHPGDPHAQVLAFDAQTGDDARRRFESSAGEDRARRRWTDGELADPRSLANGDPRLFVRHVVYPAAFADPVVFRAVARRINLIDPPDVLETDHALHQRALAGYARRYPDGPGWTLERSEIFDRIERAGAGLASEAP